MKYRDSIVKTLDLLISESSKNITDENKIHKLEAWHIGLDDISDEQIFEGLKKATKLTDGFLMACGEFRQLCLTDPGNMTIEGQAHQVWSLIISNLNHCISPYFKDSVISESIRRMGGWINLCMMETKNEPFEKKEFITIYNSIKKSGNSNFECYLSGEFGVEYTTFIGYDPEEENKLTKQIMAGLLSGERDKSKLLKMITNKNPIKKG